MGPASNSVWDPSEAVEDVAQVRQRYEHHGQELTAIHEFMEALACLMARTDARRNATRDLDALSHVLAATRNAVEAEAGSILVLDEDAAELVFCATCGPRARDRLWRRVRAGTGLAGWVTAQRKPVVVNDTVSDERFDETTDALHGHRVRSLVAAPVLVRGRTLGAVEMLNKHGGNLFHRCDQAALTVAGFHIGRLLGHMAGDQGLAETVELTSARRKVRAG
jgi:GAF domain-containing protein